MKAIVLAVWFLLGMGMATSAAMDGMIPGIAIGSAVMGGAIGYLIGRVDLRRELGLPPS